MSKKIKLESQEGVVSQAVVESNSNLMQVDRCLLIDEVDDHKRAVRNGDILGRLWSTESDGWDSMETTRSIFIYRTSRHSMYLFSAASCLRDESTLSRRRRVIEIIRKA